MESFAFSLTKWVLDTAKHLIKADVRMHNVEFIQDHHAIIFAVNHFTRLETLLLPYEIYKHTGKFVWSLAASELFVGRIGAYMRKMGTQSTKDPDRDKIIIRSLLKGDHPWIIFPEGQMIKDKKVVDAKGNFKVWNKDGRRPPHKGIATLALRAEFYRHKIQCAYDNPNFADMGAIREMFELDGIHEVLNRKTVIIPVNITYFPIRSRKNVIMNMGRALAGNLSPRAIEELSVEGTLLSEDSDIDITLCEPIHVDAWLQDPAYRELMACGDDLRKLELDPRSLFSEAADQIMMRYMGDIYQNVTINYDHIFATLIRYQRSQKFTERNYRNRVFLCAHRILKLHTHRLHSVLESTYRDIIYEDPSMKFFEFIDLCLEEGVLVREGRTYKKNPGVKGGHSDFHHVRQTEPTYVIANEIEPLTQVNALIKDVSRMSRNELSTEVRNIFIQEDQVLFEEAYATYKTDDSHPMDVGRPYLLTPKRIKAGIVLIHGYMAAPLEVRALADHLCERGFAVYAVRLAGHGTAPEDLAHVTWENWYESVNRGYTIIKSLTDEIIMGGFSTGGTLALHAAGRKGNRIKAVFAINAPLQLRNINAKFVPSIVAVNSFLKRFRKDGVLEYVTNSPENKHINYYRNPMTGVRELERSMDAMEKAVPFIAVPTLLVQASQDPIVHPESAPQIFQRIGTDAKELVVLERSRHGIINGEGADAVYEHVDFFLDRVMRPKPIVAESIAEAT